MNLLYVILIAISLSMDAFSLSLSIGTLSIPLMKSVSLSLVTGLFHFIMPTLGFILGREFVGKFNVDTHLLSGIIFVYIAIQMFKEFRSNEVVEFNMSFIDMLIFAFGVSLDSFGVGFTFSGPLNEMIISFLIFTVFSATFTFLGLMFGKKMSKIFGNLSILFGTSIMAILAIINFVNFCSFN